MPWSQAWDKQGMIIFSCDQALRTLLSVCLSACLSVWLSVCPSVRLSHLFHYVPIIVGELRWWTGSSLVQVMAYGLFYAKPLPEPMLPYYQLNAWKQISGKFKSEFNHLHSRKFIWKIRQRKWQPFMQGEMSYMQTFSIPENPSYRKISCILNTVESGVQIFQMLVIYKLPSRISMG